MSNVVVPKKTYRFQYVQVQVRRLTHNGLSEGFSLPEMRSPVAQMMERQFPRNFLCAAAAVANTFQQIMNFRRSILKQHSSRNRFLRRQVPEMGHCKGHIP